jgi:septum formation topological specificity factor MinE
MNAASEDTSIKPSVFAVKDCALIAIATGKQDYTLPELRNDLQTVSTASIYYHFWGSLLQPRFEEREFNNDFASWARHSLHDNRLAERLAVIDPTDYKDLEELRRDLLDIIEEHLDSESSIPWVRANRPFEFIRSQIVVFDTHRRVEQPSELAQVIPRLSPSSIFYHFIDARRRMSDTSDDFRLWLSGHDGQYDSLCEDLAGVDPYFGSLSELRNQLTNIFNKYFQLDVNLGNNNELTG